MRRRTNSLAGIAAALTFMALGCTTVEQVDEDDTGGTPPATAESIDLLVDTNRDGLLTLEDSIGEELWTTDSGAVFMANVDDDNQDQIRDFENAFVDGELDLLDLARIEATGADGVPDDAVVTLSVDNWSARHLKIHRLNGDGSWAFVLGSDGPCGSNGDVNCNQWVEQLVVSGAELKAGLQLGVEGKTFRGMVGAHSLDPASGMEIPWNGVATLTLSAVGADGAPVTSESNPDGTDTVQIAVAPWLMFGNLTPETDTVYANNFDPEFVGGINTAVVDHGEVFFWQGPWSNQWIEDYMQTGFTSIPAGDGFVHGMRVAMPRPFAAGNELPVNFLRTNHFAPDYGYIEVYRQAPSGSTYDSFGNHDLIPPYEGYPYGRIIHGSGVLQETQDFYTHQLAQGPQLIVNTSWLIVGHVDEALSYVPANTDRGWKLLVASPSLALEMFAAWQAAGQGAAVMHEGKFWNGNSDPADITIDALLADEDILTASNNAQAEIDGMVAAVKAEVGLTDDEIIEIPSAFEFFSGGHVAYNPGTVNSLVFETHIVMPDPHGPTIDGEDGMMKDLVDRLSTPVNGLGADGQGLKVFFTENWDLYHRLLGEVHCGTNQSGPPQHDFKWWEVMQ